MINMKFIADHMLGRLAKWLRFMGYDVMYPKVMEDSMLADIASKEGRILLTRDVQLSHTKKARTIYVKSDKLDEQIDQMIRELHITDEHMFSRCAECNETLESIEKEKATGKVPDRVLETHDELYFCRRCGRFYWKGTHYKNIEERLRKMFSEKEGEK